MRKHFYFTYKEFQHPTVEINGTMFTVMEDEESALNFRSNTCIDILESTSSDIEEVHDRLNQAEETIKKLTEDMNKLKSQMGKKIK